MASASASRVVGGVISGPRPTTSVGLVSHGGDSTQDPPPRVSTPSERLERSAAGRLLISVLVVVLVGTQIATHLPDSAIERRVSPTAARVVRMLGAEQAWGVFAPNPRSVSLDLEARITYEDGSTATWEVPEGSRIGGNLRYYRWRKWLERVRSDSYRGLWRPTAQWIADIHDGGPSPVVKVELVRRFHDNVVTGPQPAWEEYTYFTLRVDPERDR